MGKILAKHLAGNEAFGQLAEPDQSRVREVLMAVLSEPNCIKVTPLPPTMAALHTLIVDSREEGSPLCVLCVTGRRLMQRHTVLFMLLWRLGVLREAGRTEHHPD